MVGVQITIAKMLPDLNLVSYSRKYWRELNLAVGSQIAITKKNIGSSVRDRHMYNNYMQVRNIGGF